MGNCCGKPDSDPFASPGRVLGTAPPKAQTAPVPTKARTVGGPPRTLGGSTAPETEARARAAQAAEARAKGPAKPKGKLGDQLDAQRRQTRTDTLKEVSSDETRRREADAQAEARAYN